MRRQAGRSRKETVLLDRFESYYQQVRAPVMAEIERKVCGCDFGGNSWTTKPQAEQMALLLALRPDVRLLELGAGSGWPGLYIAKTSGCDAALVDIPLNGLGLAAERAAKDGLAGNVTVVAADASALPFAAARFDAISHSDLLCCLEPKRAVLVACRKAVSEQGRMAFTVISVVPGLSADDYSRAVAAGPDFIETDTDYGALLAETGWVVSRREDITGEFKATCRRQIEADEGCRPRLEAWLGTEECAERMAGWRAKLAALDDGLLLRELFLAVPRRD